MVCTIAPFLHKAGEKEVQISKHWGKKSYLEVANRVCRGKACDFSHSVFWGLGALLFTVQSISLIVVVNASISNK